MYALANYIEHFTSNAHQYSIPFRKSIHITRVSNFVIHPVSCPNHAN